jgi:hypothetical protein
MSSASERVASRLKIDLDAAEALLAASDGDEDTAVAVYVGYNDGDIVEGDIGIEGIAQREEGKRLFAANSVLAPFLEASGALVLDGGLATELEAKGANIKDDLWSARLLQDGGCYTRLSTAAFDAYLLCRYCVSLRRSRPHTASSPRLLRERRRRGNLRKLSGDPGGLIHWAR